MPGRNEPLETMWTSIRAEDIQVIICLTGPEEIRARSPAYAGALAANTAPCAVECFPIADYGIPEDREAFWALASRVAQRLTRGHHVLIHCGAGIGRTGMLAACVLLALGRSEDGSAQAVSSAGSHPETPPQRALVSWCAARRDGMAVP
jgi:protein tyrosine/serine phosphatase